MANCTLRGPTTRWACATALRPMPMRPDTDEPSGHFPFRVAHTFPAKAVSAVENVEPATDRQHMGIALHVIVPFTLRDAQRLCDLAERAVDILGCGEQPVAMAARREEHHGLLAEAM